MKYPGLRGGMTFFCSLLFSASAMSAPAMPDTSGWSGHVAVGAGAGQAETNLIDGIGPIELGDDRLDALTEDPDSEGFGFPVLAFDLAYTIAETGTQFYTRFQPSPHIFLDLEAHAGLRQQLEDVGILDVSMTASAPVTKVWKDPYLSGADRGDTERSVSGLNVGWHNVMLSPLTVEISSQEIEIDDEESGASLSLAASDQRLLRRTGQVYRYHLEYEWKLGDRQVLVPAISYLDYQLDGDAMAEDGVALQLTHEYLGNTWNFVSSIYYRSLDAGATNPIFSQAADREVYGVALMASYPQPLGWENWEANARLSWYESDNDVDFYDESLGLIMLGASYRF